jgi:hypothetical protein
MNKPIVRKTDHERGMILVVATIVVIAMTIMATPFLAKLSSQYRITDKSYKSLAAFNLAEEGIDRALWEMNQPYAVTGGIVAIDENGNGTLVATNEAVGDKTGAFQGVITTNYGVEPNVRTLVSTGSMPHIANLLINRTVNVNMEKYFKSIWDLGLFGDEGVWGKTNVMTDSFNSTKGAYGASLPGGGVNKGSKGHVGTNATGDSAIEIAQGSSSAFYGNLIAGAGTNPDPLVLDDVISIPSESAFKDGTRKILSAPFELPPVDLWSLPPRDMFSTTVDFHNWFTSQPPVESPLPSSIIATGYNKGNLSSSKTTLTPADSGVYTNFDIAKGKTVTIQGNVAIYVTGLDGATASFSGKNANINIAANSSLTLILGKTTASIVNNVSINSTGTAPNCLILGTEQFTGDFSLRNNAEIRAAIYMPQANYIVSQADVHLYGAVVCDYIDIRNNINVHYDEALGDLDYIKGGIPYWRITTWQEPLGD